MPRRSGVPCRSLSGLLSLVLATSASAQIHFAEGAEAAGVADRGGGNGAAFGDPDGDGWLDLLVLRAPPSEGALLYRNRGDGTFDAGAFDWTPPSGTVAGLFVDDDGDGDEDVFAIVYQGRNQLHHNAGPGSDGRHRFTLVPRPAGFRESRRATGAFFADLDRDGVVDVITTHRDWEPNQWVTAPYTSAMSDLAPLASPLRSGSQVFSATPFDYDGDGDLDVYVCSFHWTNLLHRSDGPGLFRTVPGAEGMASDAASIAALPADADGDGDLDLYVTNVNGQPNHLFVNDPGAGPTRFVDRAAELGVAGAENSAGGAWADFDDDGHLDLIVSNVAAGPRIYRNRGDGAFAEVTPSAIDLRAWPAGGTLGTAVGDVDRDGDVDVFLATPDGSDQLLLNRGGPGRHWLTVDLGNEPRNAGTRVEVRAAGVRRRLDYAPLTAFGTHHGTLLHFGLGESAAAVDVEVSWASGQRQVIPTEPDRILRLLEPVPDRDLAVARVLEPGLAPGWSGFRGRVEVENRGRQRVTGATLEARVSGPSGSAYVRRALVPDVDPGRTETVAFEAWRPAASGTYEVTFALDVDDDNGGNDDWRRAHTFHEFRDVAPALGVDDSGPGWAAAFADYDGDGDLDLYVSNGGSLGVGANVLYRNDGAAGFADVTDAAGVADDGNGTGVVFADFDRDGDQDLFIAKGGFTFRGERNRLFRNEGAGAFTDVSADWGLDAERSSYAAAVGDFDRDGWLDLFVSQLRGQESTLYRNRGGTFEDVTRRKGIQSFFQFSNAAAAFSDFDNDGDVDLYAGVFGDYDRFYADEGDTAYAVQPVGDRGDMVGLTLGDYDADGDLDLYTVNQSGRSALYRNDRETRSLVDLGTESGTENKAPGTGCAFADLESDGDLDLLVANAFAENRAYVNLGDGTFVDQARAFGLADTSRSRAVLVGDVDGDGDPDAYVVNEGVANRLYENGGGPNHWLAVAVRGTASNTDGIGARITAHVEGRAILREVNGTSGMSYSSRVVHFGLGPARLVDSLVVHWPSGAVDRWARLPADAAVDLVEGGVLTAVADGEVDAALGAFELAAAYPNPFNAATVLRFALPWPGEARLAVYNELGQRVRLLVDDEERAAGSHGVAWDGRDDGGRQVASGVYYAQLDAAGRRRVRPMALVR